jgi:hypothetical protein
MIKDELKMIDKVILNEDLIDFLLILRNKDNDLNGD